MNSRGDSWQGSFYQGRINSHPSGIEGESRSVVSPLRRNKLKFSKYANDDPTEWLNRVAHYFEYQEVPEHKKVMMATYYMEGKVHQWWQWLRRIH